MHVRSISVPFGFKYFSFNENDERTSSQRNELALLRMRRRAGVSTRLTRISSDPFYYFLLLLRPWLKRSIDRLLQVRRRQQVFYAGLLTETTSASPRLAKSVHISLYYYCLCHKFEPHFQKLNTILVLRRRSSRRMCFPDSGYDDGDDGTSEVLTRSGACEGEDIEFRWKGGAEFRAYEWFGRCRHLPSGAQHRFFFYVSNFLIEFVLLAVEQLSLSHNSKGLR